MNILIQKFDDKFIRNLFHSLNSVPFSYPVIMLDINNNLYENYYTHKFSACIFTESLVTPEIEQFIQEFAGNIAIVIYHPNIPNFRLIERFGSITKNIVYQNYEDIQNTVVIPRLLNNTLFYYNELISKKDEIICFLDKLEYLPDNLIKYLYPNKYPKKIKLFNNSKIPHYQNLGLLTEWQKAHLLREYSYYLDINKEYGLEAQISNCVVLDINDLSGDIISKQNTYNEHQFITFEDFINTVLCLH